MTGPRLPALVQSQFRLPAVPQPLVPKAVAGAVQPCPEEGRDSSYLPCDARLLRIAQKGKKETQVVSCTTSARDDPSLDYAQRELLDGADLLLECVADYRTLGLFGYDKPKTEIEDKTHAVLVLTGETMPACPHGRHETLRVIIDGVDEKKLPLFQTNEAISLLAPDLDRGGFSVLGYAWPFGDQRRRAIRVHLDSCGLRPGQNPVRSLSGRVLIWPKEHWQISWKIPALRSREISGGNYQQFGEKAGTVSESAYKEASGWGASRTEMAYEQSTRVSDRERVTSDKFSASSNFKSYSGETELTTRDGQMSVKRTETATISAGPLAEKEWTATSETGEPTEVTSGWKVKPVIILKQNENELEVTEILNTVLQMAQQFRKFSEDFCDCIPKLGFWVECSAAFMAGEISGVWGMEPAKAASHARIWQAERFFKFKIDIQLLDVKAKAFFGLKIAWGKFGKWALLNIEVGAFAEFEATASVKADFHEWTRSGKAVKAEGKISAKGGARGTAHLLGIGYDSERSLTMPGEIEADLTVGGDAFLSVSGKIRFKRFIIVLKASGPFHEERDGSFLAPKGKGDLWNKEFCWPKGRDKVGEITT